MDQNYGAKWTPHKVHFEKLLGLNRFIEHFCVDKCYAGGAAQMTNDPFAEMTNLCKIASSHNNRTTLHNTTKHNHTTNFVKLEAHTTISLLPPSSSPIFLTPDCLAQNLFFSKALWPSCYPQQLCCVPRNSLHPLAS